MTWFTVHNYLFVYPEYTSQSVCTGISYSNCQMWQHCWLIHILFTQTSYNRCCIPVFYGSTEFFLKISFHFTGGISSCNFSGTILSRGHHVLDSFTVPHQLHTLGTKFLRTAGVKSPWNSGVVNNFDSIKLPVIEYGYEIGCRSSLCLLSVMLLHRDHIRWNSLKILSQLCIMWLIVYCVVGQVYTVSQKTCHFILDHNSRIPWQIFYTVCTSGNKKEHCTYQLQILPLHPHSVFTLPDKTAARD